MAQRRRDQGDADWIVPLLLGVGAIWAGVDGARRLANGQQQRAEAERLVEDALLRHSRAADRVEKARAQLEARARGYAEQQRAIMQGPMADVIAFLKVIKQRSVLRPVAELVQVQTYLPSPGTTLLAPVDPRDVLVGLSQVVLTGASAGQGALAIAGLIGVASTGATIHALHGAAASSATLAWLGGGAVEVGGGGIALGRVVLGGVVVGAALFVAGVLVESQGAEAFTQALARQADINLRIADCESLIRHLGCVQTRIKELNAVASALTERLQRMLARMDATRWSIQCDADVRELQVMLILARALGEVLQTPVVDPSGQLTPASAQLLLNTQALLAMED